MNTQQHIIFGMDLGTTYSCTAYVDDAGKAVVLPNQEHQLTTPSIVLFEDDTRIVGEEAKNNALLNPEDVVEMVKRHMGEADWRFQYKDRAYSPEEISSYILRKLAADTQQALGIPVKEVIITCPAYFGIAQREATARAGEIAGLHVHEVLSEPTAAAIAYGLQQVKDQTVLVFDLGGGTFDVTIIDLKKNATVVIATGGDHHLGGRDWDEAVIRYLAHQWQISTESPEDPLNDPETLQDLWLKAEKAKISLTVKPATRVVVSHGGRNVKVELTRDKFNELTASLLHRTILFTRMTLDAAFARGHRHIDQIVLVGGSTKMPQIAQRLELEFHLPYRLFEPDEAVAKGAALYGQRLLFQKKVHAQTFEIAKKTAEVASIAQKTANIATTPNTSPFIERLQPPAPILKRQQQRASAQTPAPSQTPVPVVTATIPTMPETPSITNVASHSFGIIATIDHGTPRERKVISNLVRVNDPLPITQKRIYGTIEAGQDVVELEIIENTEETWIVEPEHFAEKARIGKVVITLPTGLPENAPIEVIFELNTQGRLHVTSREPHANTIIDVAIETQGILSPQEVQQARQRAEHITIL